MAAVGVRGPAISACNARIPMDAMHLPLVFPSPRFRLIMFAFRSTARLPPLNDRCAFSCLENVQRTCASNALSRDYVSRLMEMRESVDLNLPRRNCFSHGFSRVLGFFASAVGHRWGSIMLESLKASLFLFFLFSLPSFWKKRYPLRCQLRLEIRLFRIKFYQTIKRKRGREESHYSFIESFSHYRTWFVRNMVLNTVNQTSDKEREIEKEGISHVQFRMSTSLVYIYIQTNVL